MYSRDTLVLDDVLTALDSKEKMKQITNGGSEVKAEGLNVRGEIQVKSKTKILQLLSQERTCN